MGTRHYIDSEFSMEEKEDPTNAMRFVGEWLDKRVGALGVDRQEGESDWNLRRRAFIEHFSVDQLEALELLFAAHHEDWSKRESMLAGTLNATTHEDLARFADGFAEDPVLKRFNVPVPVELVE